MQQTEIKRMRMKTTMIMMTMLALDIHITIIAIIIQVVRYLGDTAVMKMDLPNVEMILVHGMKQDVVFQLYMMLYHVVAHLHVYQFVYDYVKYYFLFVLIVKCFGNQHY